LFTIVSDPKTTWDLSVLPLAAEEKPFDVVKTAAQEGIGQFSPDGRWLAYQSNESGSFEVYVRPFPGPGAQVLISTKGGGQARWSPDGKELYCIASEGTLMAVPIRSDNGALEAGTPTALFQPPISGGDSTIQREQYDVAADGRFLINTEQATTAPITMLLNSNALK
jgi:Tol biopolymer transport system component